MVKNLPTVERSTKIRFGKNVPDSDVQAENTIIINASNTLVTTPNSGSIYMAPVRFRNDIVDPNVVLMMYNRVTGELSESGESANALVGGQTLEATTDRGNTTSNTVQFLSPTVGIVTAGKVGVSNLLPGHTLSIGSNVYVDDTGSNVLVISGGVLLDGNLTVNGGVTSITTENLKIKDAIIELGQNNTSGDTTLDLGLIMTRPQSNVTVGFLESPKEIVLAFTESSADSNTITPLTSEDINVHVYGRLYTEANVGVLNTNPMHTLDVGSNLYVDEFGSNILVVSGNTSMSGDLTVDTGTLHVDVGNKSIGLGTVVPDANLHVVGNVYVNSNLTVDNETLHVDAGASHVGVNTKNPQANLHIVGNTYISSDLTVDNETLHVDAGASHVGVNTKNPQANLHVVGNTYISSDLTVDTDTLHVDAGNKSIGLGTVVPDANLHVVGNVYVSDDLTIATNTLHVEASSERVGIKTKTPDAELHVVGNVYVSSNLTVDTDTFHVDTTMRSIGVGTVVPKANLHIVGNVYVSSDLTVDTDTFHVDAGNNKVGVKTKVPDAELHVVGNVYVSSNLTVDTDTFHVDTTMRSIGVGTVNPTANLHVVGNVYVSSNLTVDTDTFHVDAVNDSVGVGTKNPTSNLHVVGNAYVSSNTTMGGTLTINHPTTAILTDLNSNVEIKLNQLANVILGEKALANEDILVYDGSNWVNQLQNHTFLTVKAGEAINKGEAVYASGSVDDNTFIVRKALANSSTTMPALGVAYQDFANNDQGLIVTFGQVSSLNTNNFLKGETVYVSNVTAGGVSNVQPYGTTDLIQNVGLVLKQDVSDGIISVTGVGRANDIPNAPVVQDESDINYVYVNDENNDFKKIEPSNLLTQLQTFEQVSSAGNVVSNIMSFTNARTGLTVSSNLHVGSNISVTGLSDPNNKYLPMVNHDGFFQRSPVYVTDGGKYVISSSEAEFLGNITLSGNTTIINAGSVTISDRIFGLAANNSTSGLDSGIIIEHQEDGAFANVALIFHADEHRFSIGYTQNTFTDNHILHYQDPGGLIVDLRGNVLIQNSATLSSTLDVTGAVTFANDFTVGPASNLFVDVSTSRVGINEASPTVSLDVGGDARVQGTTTSSAKTNGALVVAGGVGITGPLFGAAATLDGVTTITNNTTSDAKGNGALVVAGGVGITGPLFGATATFDGDVSGLEGIFSGDLTVGGASNLFVDVSLSRVGVNTATPQAGLHVVGNAYVSSNLQVSEYTKILDATDATSKTTGALTVAGGLGVTMNIHGKDIFVEDIVSNSVVVLDTTNATSKTTGALQVLGGLGVTENIHGKDIFVEDIVSNSVVVLDTTNATSKTTGALQVLGGLGVTENIHGKDVFVEDIVSNSVVVLDTTVASSNIAGAVIVSGGIGVAKGIYAATVNVTDQTDATSKTTGALQVLGGLGVTKNIHGKDVFVEDVFSNSVVVLDTTAASSNAAGAVIVSGGIGVAKGIYAATVNVTDQTDATSKTTGALQVLGGLGVTKNIHGKDIFVEDIVSNSVAVLDTTQATSITTGALTIAGGISTQTNVHAANVYVTGGLITNTGGVTKKTYSFSNIVTSGGSAPEINVYFTSNVFYSKMTAQLVDATDEVSTLVLEMAGGSRNGTVPGKNIKIGTKNIFGDASSTPWSSNVLVASNRIMITPSGALDNSGNCHVFLEYTSDVSTGGLSNVQFDFDQHVVTFGY